MLGHWRPIFLRFAKGGKMVATCGGAFLGARAGRRRSSAPCVWLVVFLADPLRVGRLDRRRGLAAVSPALLLGEPWPVIVFSGAAASACSSSIAGTSPGCAPGPRRASSSAASRPAPS